MSHPSVRMARALAIAAFVSSLSLAADAQVLPALTPKPEVMAILEGLGENEGARLPEHTVVGEGLDAHESFARLGPGIRDFSRKWVYADSRARALYCAGNHGVPHKFNDVWEYDLASNTWVMLHPPDAGVQTSHTWWGLTYDQERDRLLWMAPAGRWDRGGYDGPPLWSYDPFARAAWEVVRTDPNIRISLAGTLEYIPGRDVVLWYGNQWDGSGLQQLDPATNTWTELLSQGSVYFDNPDAPPAEAVITYNSVNDVLVGAHGRDIFVYDFDDNAWTRVLTDIFPNGVSDNRAAYDYDPINDVHLIHVKGELFAYHYTTNTLEALTPDGDDVPDRTETMAFFHRSLGVLVVYDESPTPWVYRYGGTGVVVEPTPDGGTADAGDVSSTDGGSSSGADGGGGARADGGGGDDGGGDDGCGCRAAGGRGRGDSSFAMTASLLLLCLCVGARRRRR